MNYRQLQQALKAYKQKGLTDIALNSKKAVLQAEIDRIQSLRVLSEEVEDTSIDIEDSQAVDLFFTEAKEAISELKAKYSETEAEDEFGSNENDTLTNLDWYPDPMRSAIPETEIYQPKYNGLLTSLIILLIATIKILIVTVFEPLVVIIEGLKQLQLIPPTIPKLLPNCWYRIKPSTA